jgi:ubiquinone biosynthesis protein Coq4
MKQDRKTIFQKALDLLFQVHLKTSTWVAKLIGPTVFNFGTKDRNWNISTRELLQFPDNSLGRALGEFLAKDGLEPLPGAEYHDAQHVLLDYSVSFKDEVALQFFLHGNGKRSIASVSTMIGAWCILPTQWKYLRTAYERGKQAADISALNLKTLLSRDLDQIKYELFKKSYQAALVSLV